MQRRVTRHVRMDCVRRGASLGNGQELQWGPGSLHQLRQELRGLLRALIEVARQDGPITGAELGVLLSFVEGWALFHFGEPMDHDLATQLARRLARQPSKPENLTRAMHSLRLLSVQHPERAEFLRRHLEAMAALNALPNGRARASHRLLLRTLGATAPG